MTSVACTQLFHFEANPSFQLSGAVNLDMRSRHYLRQYLFTRTHLTLAPLSPKLIIFGTDRHGPVCKRQQQSANGMNRPRWAQMVLNTW